MDQMHIHIVDDDAEILESVAFMLRAEGHDVHRYHSAEQLLEGFSKMKPGCLLVDLRLPGMSGLALQKYLHEHECDFPVVLMTGHGEVSSAVRAMKEGAVDFLEKPFSKSDLMAALGAAEELLTHPHATSKERRDAEEKLGHLTRREHQVLEGLVKGHPNKTIAYDLGISPRTIEVHRANAMKKLEVQNLSEMLHIAFMAGMMDHQDDAAA